MTVATQEAGPLRQGRIDEARRFMETALKDGREPILAYSGGKDGLASALIAQEFGVTVGLHEDSLLFTRQRDEIKTTALMLGFKVTHRRNLDYDILRRKPQLLFPYKRCKMVDAYCAMKQRRAFEDEARQTGRLLVITGRKRSGNTVKAPIYEKGDLLMCHPLTYWHDRDVWAWLAHKGVAKPWVYGTPFGVREGNGSWPMYRESPDLMTCWKAIWLTEPDVVRHSEAAGVRGAAEAVQEFGP